MENKKMEAIATGKLSWFDFATMDEEKSMAFYKSVFAWEFSPMGPNYWLITADKGMIGGLRKEPKNIFKASVGFTPYFAVPSAKEGAAMVTKSGGKLVGDVVAITNGDDGYFQTFTDLDGNALALWSAKP